MLFFPILQSKYRHEQIILSSNVHKTFMFVQRYLNILLLRSVGLIMTKKNKKGEVLVCSFIW